MSRGKIDLERALRSVGDRYLADSPADLAGVREGVLRKSRRRTWIIAMGAAAAAGVALLVLLTVNFEPARERTLPAGEATPTAPVEITIPIADELAQVASSGDFGYVTGASSVGKVAPGARRELWLTDVGGAAADIVASGEDVWITLPATMEVVRLDAASGEVLQRISLEGYGAPRRLTVGESKLRVAIDGYGVVIIDRATTEVTDLFRGDVVDTAQGENAFWVLTADGEILPLHPETGTRVPGIAAVGGLSPNAEITFTRQALWYGSYDDDRIVRIHEGVGRITHTQALPGNYADLDGGSQRLWLLVATNDGDGRLIRLDPGNAEPIERQIPLTGDPADLSSGGEGIWVVLAEQDRVVHLLP